GYWWFGDKANSGTPLNVGGGLGGVDGSQTEGLGAGTNNIGLPNAPSTKSEVVIGSISVMHVPTGLYANFVAADRHLINPSDAVNKVGNPDGNYWYVQAGITKRFFEPGATTLYVDYGEYYDMLAGANYCGSANFGASCSSGTGLPTVGETVTSNT